MRLWTEVLVLLAEIEYFVPHILVNIQVGLFEVLLHALVRTIESANLDVFRHFYDWLRLGVHVKPAVFAVTRAQLFGSHCNTAVFAVAQKHRTCRWADEHAAILQVVGKHLIAVIEELNFTVGQAGKIERLSIYVSCLFAQKLTFPVGKRVEIGKEVLPIRRAIVEALAVGRSVLVRSGGPSFRVCIFCRQRR